MAPARPGRALTVKKFSGLPFFASHLLLAIFVVAGHAAAQAKPVARTFSNPISEVQQVVDDVKSSSSGRLPILEGFVDVGDQPLNGYERGYYVCTLQVLPAANGGATVQVTSKITAWYTDPESARSGYRELNSNGHVETDLLDRIEDALAHKATPHAPGSTIRIPPAGPMYTPPPANQPSPKTPATAAAPATPQPAANSSPNGESSSNKNAPAAPALPGRTANTPAATPANAAAGESLESIQARRAIAEERARQISADIKGLEEIQQNQVRPVDLVIVTKPGVSVFSKPEEGAPVLFTADQEDEFQILGLEGAWVHVEISGASRGWMRRSQVELPSSYGGSGATKATATAAASPATADLFKVAREETNTFSGKWDPLQGKTVRVVWVEPAEGASSSPAEKRKFAKYLLLKAYKDMASSDQKVFGVVVVFDSADGGQIAATMESLKALQDGSTSDAAFWKAASLDPPEAFQDAAKS
jgi:hypothetical protein